MSQGLDENGGLNGPMKPEVSWRSRESMLDKHVQASGNASAFQWLGRSILMGDHESAISDECFTGTSSNLGSQIHETGHLILTESDR